MSVASPLEESGFRVIEPSKLVAIKDHTPDSPIFGKNPRLWFDFLSREDARNGGSNGSD